MKIKSIDNPSLCNDEHFQFHTEVKDLVNLSIAEILKIAIPFQEIFSLFSKGR